jgi:hypothetical protein
MFIRLVLPARTKVPRFLVTEELRRAEAAQIWSLNRSAAWRVAQEQRAPSPQADRRGPMPRFRAAGAGGVTDFETNSPKVHRHEAYFATVKVKPVVILCPAVHLPSCSFLSATASRRRGQ